MLKTNKHRIKIDLLLLFVFFIFGANFNSKAQNKLVFDSLSKSISLQGKISVFFDKKASLPINEIQNLNKTNKFKSKFKDIPAYTKSAVWLVVKIENRIPEEIFLELQSSLLNHVSVYTTSNSIVLDSANLGSDNAFTDRPIKTSNFTFVIKPGKYTYYIRIKSDTYLPFSINLYSKKELYIKNYFLNLLNSLILGTLILTLLYNLLLYFSVRDSVYLYYLVFVFFSTLVISCNFGIGAHYFWGAYTIFSKHITILYGLIMISAILFVIKIMNLTTTMPKFYKILQIITVFVFCIIFINILGFVFLSNILLLLVYSSLYFSVFIASLLLIKKGGFSILLFSVSWLFSIIALLVFALQNTHIFPASHGNFDLLIYGAYVSIILLSFVIGNKLNVYSKKNKKARFKELTALKERDNIINLQKIKLEKIVKERNKEIINKNKELLVQQNEIEYQIAEIEQKNTKINKINDTLKFKNKKIEEQNTEFKSNRDELKRTVEIRTRELEKEKERATKADSLKTSFLNNLSREIKTPMSAITGYATLILNKTITKVERNEYLHVIIKNVDSLLLLIDDIVAFSRIQAGIIKMKTREIDLKLLMESVKDEFNQKLIDSNNSSVVIIVQDSENAFIKSDYQKIWLIFMQLMDNALKYTKNGSINIGYKIKEKSDREKKSETDTRTNNIFEIIFFVNDTGKGMTEQEIDRHIVNHDTETYNYDYKKGGLGLAIVLGFVNLFNGKFNIKSELGKGTNVTFAIHAEIIA